MQHILNFLTKLEANNNKEWFDANRPEYEACKQDFLVLVSDTIKEVAKFHPEIGNLEPKSCVFRINRDVRFSPDKRPYKTNFAAAFNPKGKKITGAGYYFHIQPNNNFIGGGIYAPEADLLARIRQEIDYNYDEFQKVLHAKPFQTYFEGLSNEDKLSRPPKGYDISNPAIEILKNKHFIASQMLSDKEITTTHLPTAIAARFEALYDLIQFLDRASNP